MATALAYAALGLLALSAAYICLATMCVLLFHRRLKCAAGGAPKDQPPVTILKPLCGLEHGLIENLRSFCRQDYDRFQIVFGVRDADDPVIAVVKSIRAEFPEHDLVLVVNGRVIGRNLKVSNLVNMFSAARHDILVIADSDMRVRPDYLRAVVAPFARADVGATTCLYSGSSGSSPVSRLGAMFINDWFLPSALIPAILGKLAFCFGATMAVRRAVLAAGGGFEALAGFLADDYKLGQLVAAQKRMIALVPYVVENVVAEDSLKSLFDHEIRWARTIRSVQPVGYALSAVTEILPIALVAAIPMYILTDSALLAAVPVIGALALRLGLHYAVGAAVGAKGVHAPWLVPLRDLLSLAVRISSYSGNTVLWRQQVLTVRASSRIKD